MIPRPTANSPQRARTARAPGRSFCCALLGCYALTARAAPPSVALSSAPLPGAIPESLYALNPPDNATAAPAEAGRIHLPGSPVTHSPAELNDLFFAPDWHLQPHTPMPPIVARGRAPEVFASGYCHTPSGQGRPENAALAARPAAYIIAQVEDFRTDARRRAWPGACRPSDLMIQVAQHATADQVRVAADYCAAQHLAPRLQLLESTDVPRARVVGFVYTEIAHGGREPLGERLLEFAPEAARHEHREDAMRDRVDVPARSLRRGQLIAMAGLPDGSSLPCVTCHGADLRGAAVIRGIGGRSPPYLLRALLAFQSGARHGSGSQPMRTEVGKLFLGNMIDAFAAAASP